MSTSTTSIDEVVVKTASSVVRLVLPGVCFVLLRGNPVGKRIGQVVKYASGYYPVHEPEGLGTEDDVEKFIDELNRQDGVVPAQRKAMEFGSMFGWHVPAADPNNAINQS